MSKYKVGDKVRIRSDIHSGDYGGCWCTSTMASHSGEVVTIARVCDVYNNRFYIKEIFEDCLSLWQWSDEMVEPYMEEKKMFTKSDLRNGDVIVRRNGDVEIAIVDRGILVSKTGWNRLRDVRDDLTDDDDFDNEWDIMKVYRPKCDYRCQFNCEDRGTPIYDRERDTKKLYNGKVICIDHGNIPDHVTVGKIYTFVDGIGLNNFGGELTSVRVTDVDHLNSRFARVKFLEIVE